MKVISPITMRKLDRLAIEDYKIPGIVLMENAGYRVAMAVKTMLTQGKNNETASISIFCGKGNNGGDGFVAARHLANMKYDVKVFIVADPSNITGDAAINLEIVKKMGLQIKVIEDASDVRKIRDSVADSKIIVDALLGTGLKGEVRGIGKEVIDLINELRLPVIAVDIPSGICGETGKILGNAVMAKQTVTMVLPKTGLLIYPGLEYVGELIIVDIGMPIELIKSAEAEAELLDCQWISKCFEKYPSDAHKGTFGRVFIIAGSLGMTGAAALSGLASVRGGAGLVTVGIPESLNDILEVKLTEAMTLPLAESTNRCISNAALNAALEFASKCNVVVLGPGISTNEETKQFVLEFVQNCEVPMVVDADGLNILAEYPHILANAKAKVVITPHPGEMAKLLASTPSKIQEDRLKAAKTAAQRYNCVVVLKGARTLIANPEGMLCINPTGNAGMASGGSGDVLSGIIGAFLARGMQPYNAAAAGVYIHGLAGDIAAQNKGKISLAAGDIIEYLHEAIRKTLPDYN